MFILNYRRNLTASEMKLRDVNEKVNNGTQRLVNINADINVLKSRFSDLNDDAAALRNNATALQEANVQGKFDLVTSFGNLLIKRMKYDCCFTGALNLTRDAQRRSQEAQNRILQSTASLSKSQEIRGRVENMLNQTEIDIAAGQVENEDLLAELDATVVELNSKIPGLNSMVRNNRDTMVDDPRQITTLVFRFATRAGTLVMKCAEELGVVAVEALAVRMAPCRNPSLRWILREGLRRRLML